MRYAIIGATALFLLAPAACVSGTDTGEQQANQTASCDGAALDAHGICRAPNGRFAKTICCAPTVEYSCDVVAMDYDLNGSLFEESLSSIYEIDIDGHSLSTETRVHVELGPQQHRIRVGNYLWSTQNGDVIVQVPRDQIDLSEYYDGEVVEYRVTPNVDDGVYRVRIFPDRKLGTVFHEGNGLDGAVAHLDCRDVLSRPAEQPLDEEDLYCDIAWFDFDLRDYDGQFGSWISMDYFDTHSCYNTIDESYTNVSIELEAEGWDLYLGGYHFAQVDGDAISFEEVVFDDELGGQLTWNIAGDGWDDQFEVRIWRQTGMGIVWVRETGDEPAGKLAVIDCRGHRHPDVSEW